MLAEMLANPVLQPLLETSMQQLDALNTVSSRNDFYLRVCEAVYVELLECTRTLLTQLDRRSPAVSTPLPQTHAELTNAIEAREKCVWRRILPSLLVPHLARLLQTRRLKAQAPAQPQSIPGGAA